MAGPRLLIDSPLSFSPSPYGLLSVAQAATPQSPHWQNGVTWISNCNDANTTYDECIAVTGVGSPPEPSPKEAATGLQLRGATPFTVYARFDCSPVGMDVIALANEALRMDSSRQAEIALWTGVAGAQTVIWPHLAADAMVLDAQNITLQTVPVTGAADDVASSLGFVEDVLGDCYNGQGVIHIPRLAIPTFDAWGLLKVVRGQLQTINGNLVVAGTGYPGTAPDGTDPTAGTTWIYATGAVFEMHSEARVNTLRESLDRSENTVQSIAEQTYVLGFDCCHVGAIVELGVPVT